MTTTDDTSWTAVSPMPLKRLHSWPPCQWYLDQCNDDLESPILYPTQVFKGMSVGDTVRSAPGDIVLKHSHSREPGSAPDSRDDSESESVKAASMKAIFPTSNNVSRNNLRSVRYRAAASGASSTSSRSKPSITFPPRQRKASFRDRHLKRWSYEMSRTSKRMARVLRLPRKSKDSSKSPEKDPDAPVEGRRRRSRSKAEVRNPPHEMSVDMEYPLPMDPLPALPYVGKRSSIVTEPIGRGRTLDLPRRDLMDLNGGIQAAAGMPHQLRKRHASGKRKVSREPERSLQDIKEEWNASQIHREAWAARINANAPRSLTKLRWRAASDSSVPTSLLTV